MGARPRRREAERAEGGRRGERVRRREQYDLQPQQPPRAALRAAGGRRSERRPDGETEDDARARRPTRRRAHGAQQLRALPWIGKRALGQPVNGDAGALRLRDELQETLARGDGLQQVVEPLAAAAAAALCSVCLLYTSPSPRDS